MNVNPKIFGAGLYNCMRLTTLQFPSSIPAGFRLRAARARPMPGTPRRHKLSLTPFRILSPHAAFSGRGRATSDAATWRGTMLSPHEFATLLLVKDAPNQLDMEREELDALLERQLVELERLASGFEQWRLTESGDSALRAIKRFS
jgi:hypothetical protein